MRLCQDKKHKIEKLSYEEWKEQIFKEIKERFYLLKVTQGYKGFRFNFSREFHVFVSELYFEQWYNEYLYDNRNLTGIEVAINRLDNMITKYWMREIKRYD